ncbi:hypothetical protein PR048_015071 [Dryococelus australis]|uniref:Uncharacterized protein n=1 Tax=Dryococelus australis TaxID=614101 RepID=A0ABQ9HFZ5_9NEOP|nr:hypothetical protein PR048_015071 [Dryococelus australis]
MGISLDFMQNLPLPHICTSDVFFCRQLWYCVFSVHDLADDSATMTIPFLPNDQDFALIEKKKQTMSPEIPNY